MTRQQVRIVVVALVVVALLVMIALTADGDFPPSPRDGRGFNAATATLFGAIIAGTFTLLGVVVERLVQRYGRVRCVMDPIKLFGSSEDEGIVRTLPVPQGRLDEVAEESRGYGDPAILCFVEAKLFNEKDAKTGIRDVRVVFEGRDTVELKMRDRSTWRHDSLQGIQMDHLEYVNLPSREWRHLSLVGEIELEDARKLARCDKAWLRGYYPDDRLFSERVPTQEV